MRHRAAPAEAGNESEELLFSESRHFTGNEDCNVSHGSAKVADQKRARAYITGKTRQMLDTYTEENNGY
jgi:hypothetical protein